MSRVIPFPAPAAHVDEPCCDPRPAPLPVPLHDAVARDPLPVPLHDAVARAPRPIPLHDAVAPDSLPFPLHDAVAPDSLPFPLHDAVVPGPLPIPLHDALAPDPLPIPLHDALAPDPLPIPLHDAVAPARRRHRALVTAAGRWALSEGLSLPADHVALWAATAEAFGHLGDSTAPTGPWRASQIPDFLAGIAAWCSVAGCSPPADLAESLWHLYGFLAATGRLHPAGDPLVELRAAVVVFAGFDRLRPISPLPPGPEAA